MPRNIEISTKQQAREYVRRASLKITPERFAAANRQIYISCYSILRQKNINSLFIYVSRENEADTHMLIKHFLKDKIKIYVPKVIGDNEMVAARLTSWDSLITGRYGLREPKNFAEVAVEIDMVIAPGLAFTIEGARLGQGLGYYDRWLTENSYADTIALAYEHQILSAVPTSRHDVNVAEIITEKRRIVCTSANL
ncbi:MAG: 5-formyltetrahydrofolate cyclo-ligase [Gammaproteobacteria bacterium]|mgnify:FL=1|jgi:5-formyltetrahydrofolate cyclo-ligase